MSEPKKGQLSGIPAAALYLGIAVFAVALIIAVLAGLYTSVCTQAGGTEGPFNQSPYGYVSVNPLTGSYTGCCSTVNSTDNACTAWASHAGLNTSYQGILGLGTFNDFWSVLVLIVILAIVITALYAVFPRQAGI